jgi:hypothetical protein
MLHLSAMPAVGAGSRRFSWVGLVGGIGNHWKARIEIIGDATLTQVPPNF